MVRNFFWPQKSRFSMGFLRGFGTNPHCNQDPNPLKSPLKNVTFVVKKKSWPCRIECFQKPFHFWPCPQPSLCKKSDFFERSRVSKNSRVKTYVTYGGIIPIGSRHIYMAAFSGKNPPHRGPTFLLEIFDTRDRSKKSGFLQRLDWRVAKNEIILENFWVYMVRNFFWRPKCLFQNGILGIWGQHGQIRPQNAPKQANMDKNGQSRSKTYFSNDAAPPCSHTAMHTFWRHVRTFPGHSAAVSAIFSTPLTNFGAFLVHFWPFLALLGMPCFGHFWPFWPIFPLKTGTFLVRKISRLCRREIFPKFFHFWPPPNLLSTKKPTFLSDLAYRKFRAKR